MMSNKNRRAFFRIYDEVNLFYKKIDESLLTRSQSAIEPPSFFRNSDTQSYALPSNLEAEIESDAKFDKDTTCNVNLSAGGLAFNCNASVQEGDCLVIKLLLEPGMRAIAAPCKVVYCQDNPVTDNECPYFVGAHFIGMRAEDRKLLIDYVDKKRQQRRWFNIAVLAVVVTVILLPDVVFGLLFELFHFLFEMLMEFSHLAFEFIESNLDHLIEHMFETDVHATQIIVFYILFPFVCYGLYRIGRLVPPFLRWCKRKQIAFWSRRKANLIFFWREQSPVDKLRLIAFGTAAIAFYFFFGM
ncbi:MAG: PilZ domain-containing protein [Methylobacter sp.]